MSTSNTLEDIFPSASTNKEQHPSSSPRLRAIHATAGYRDGASAAREAAIQGGFDEGFLLGAAIGARVGLLIGIVEGIAGWPDRSEGRVHSDSKARSNIKVGSNRLDSSKDDDVKQDASIAGVSSYSNMTFQAKARKLLEQMRRDLALENVLGPEFVATDGTWGWDVSVEEIERGGMDTVAEAHPLVRRYAGVVGMWVRELRLRRVGEGE